MTIEELRQIMHQLHLDCDAEPTLVYIFYETADGLVNNLTLTLRHGRNSRRQPPSAAQLDALLQQYPAAREGKVLAVEHPRHGLTRWLDTDEVCQRLHICRQTLLRWYKRGLLHPAVMGHRHYFDADEVDALLRSNVIQENGRLDKTSL
mgnify:CR=1 FL=1